MRIVFWGKGNRGVSCLQALHGAGYDVSLVVVHPDDARAGATSVGARAQLLGIPTIAPDDPNDATVCARLARASADLFVLGGYGKIIRPEVIEIPTRMSINLHGGKLPEYRGSSPMNWALIRGERQFSLSIIRVASGVDTGPVLAERTFPIPTEATIADLHAIADVQFPQMLCAVVAQIDRGTAVATPQDSSRAAYFPLRFPDDGFILWDCLTATQVHNRIRALTAPYPCAFTYVEGRKVRLLGSALTDLPTYGEPGRVYRIAPRGILVCASDRCLWVTRAVFEEGAEDVRRVLRRYDQFATVRQAVLTTLRDRVPVIV